MKSNKKAVLEFMEQKGPWIIGFGGLLLTAFCCYFQTMGFVYVSLPTCLKAVLIGFLVAFGVTYYLFLKTKPQKEHPEKRFTDKQFSWLMRNIGVMFILVAVFSFLSTSYAGFLLGIAGMSYGCGSHLIYLIFRKLMKRAEQE